MFGCSYLSDGNASSTGNVMNVVGQAGTIAQGKNYDHLYQQSPDNYVSYIGSNGGTLFFKSQDNNGRAINYNGASGDYRSIHSTFVFGALRNGANTKQQLMQTYMTYLLSYIGAEENRSDALSNIAVYPNPGRTINVSFSLTQPVHARIDIYNVAGQKVRNLLNAQMVQGSHNILFDGLDDNGTHLSSGTYIICTEHGDTRISRVVVLLD